MFYLKKIEVMFYVYLYIGILKVFNLKNKINYKIWKFIRFKFKFNKFCIIYVFWC